MLLILWHVKTVGFKPFHLNSNSFPGVAAKNIAEDHNQRYFLLCPSKILSVFLLYLIPMLFNLETFYLGLQNLLCHIRCAKYTVFLISFIILKSNRWAASFCQLVAFEICVCLLSLETLTGGAGCASLTSVES